ncbi:MAG: hypothetical protein DU429_00480 [Candidatus Tokpelaia sp.]|nr:MAG: hypothetical protein DU430_06910 [Candidatus Tokpelaia sp.]KAA6207580.1 MAG: hypothetical protein DU429_00480 [Candidatus Tokpelaia sp.]
MAIEYAEHDIIIAGAGIAGMAAALALAAHNIPSTLYEKSSVLQEVGAGLQLAPNATRLLDKLGLLAALTPLAAEPDFINLNHADSGKILLHLPIKAMAEQYWHAPYLTIHRADLQKVLKENIDKNPLIHYYGSHSVNQVRGNAQTGFQVDIVTLQEEQEKSQATAEPQQNSVETLSARCVICCDGVWSRLRAACCGEKARFSSYIAWRSTLERQNLPADFAGGGVLDSVSAYMSKDSHFIIYPLRQGAVYNFVIITKGKNIGDKWSQQGDKEQLLQLFNGKNPLLRAVIDQAPSWLCWPLFQMPFPRFSNANGVIFLGDAAHAVTPFSAQGAAQAIEDACALAQFIATGLRQRESADNAAELSRFSALREQRLKAVAGRGDFNRFVYHLSGPAAFIRNQYMRLRPQRRFLSDLDWLYGYDAVAPFSES